MSDKEVSKTQEETEMMQAAGVPAQETEGVGAVIAPIVVAE